MVAVVVLGAIVGLVNGVIVTRIGIPSFIVTLAMLVTWRDALRWTTEGAWVQDLPANFQWLGLGQQGGEMFIVALALIIFISFAWILRNMVAGRKVYAVGSDSDQTM